MTSFGLTSVSYAAPDRRWLLDDHGTEYMPGVPLDLTLFDAATHYPAGFVPSGMALGKVTATGKYGPYLPTANDGRQTVVGIAFNPVQIYQPGSLPTALVANVGMPILVHGFVDLARLPFTSGNAPLGGYIDAAAQTALKNVVFLSNPAG